MKTLYVLTTLAFLASCGPAGPKTGGQTGEETIGCRPKTTTALDRDEDSPNGYAAGDLLAIAEGDHTVPFTWDAHEPTTAEITITATGTFEYVEYEMFDSNDPDNEIELTNAMAGFCDPQVEIPVSVSLTTADGLLDEQFDARISSPTEDSMFTYTPVELDQLTGSFVVTTEVPDDDPTWVNTAIDFEFSGDVFTGDFHSMIERTDGGDLDGAVSAETIVFGSWETDPQ